MDLEENEMFEDACENLPEETEHVPSLEDSVKETVVALDLFLKNHFNQALDLMKPYANRSIYHSLGKGTVLFMQAVLTLAPADIDVALQALNQAVDVCNRKRKRGAVLYVSKMIGQVDYNSYTEEEVHAELCYAECLLLTAILTFLADQSFMNFVKGGLKVRTCYQSYKECLHILENRNWKNNKHRQHYASGVKMGIGTFNLMISQFPTRILRLLEFIGFSGNKNIGLRELKESYEETNGLRSPLAVLILVAYHTVISYVFGMGDGDINQSEDMLEDMLIRYPNGALFLFFYGRVKQIQGKFNDSIRIYKQSIDSQKLWKQFHYLCYWEMMWCYCSKCEWVEASKCTEILRKECRWSPAIYTYVHATILHTIAEEQRTTISNEIIELMRTVPGLKQKVAGKSYPTEKYVVGKSNKFFNQNCRLLLPMMVRNYLKIIFFLSKFSHYSGSP
ncbi:tetratricopeptide repeat protein 39B-like [Centruroides sculpturatus]|uniref:tetratricopeptide repeat protein 39B-like n=1 Tax=Centruroides sculpturatus TaxID=218467 RepID=UPI000C6CE2AE|nr:tetratricopeptide repeat protein 39B-like [Centruroides sculpturatus]